MSFVDFLFFLTNSFVRIQNISASDFEPLLLQGITTSTLFRTLFESHSATTVMPLLTPSFIAFLSIHGSATTRSFGSM